MSDANAIDPHAVIQVHTSASVLRKPGKMLRDMVHDVVSCRQMAWMMAVRDIKAEYRQSLLGILWAFLPPIFVAIGLTAAKNAQVITFGETTLPYPAYVMFSMALWQTFVNSLNGPFTGLRMGKGVLTKVAFPRETVVFAELVKTLFNFSIQLILIIAVFIWYRIPVSWTTFTLAPLSLCLLILLGTTIGLFIAPLAMLYRDISNSMTYLVQWWLFVTPVIYTIPANTGLFATVVKMNPVTPLLVGTRELAAFGTLPNPSAFLLAGTCAVVGFFVGLVYFRLAMPLVVERWSS